MPEDKPYKVADSQRLHLLINPKESRLKQARNPSRPAVVSGLPGKLCLPSIGPAPRKNITTSIYVQQRRHAQPSGQRVGTLRRTILAGHLSYGSKFKYLW